ncbi:MAG: hypothetical protein JRI31_01795 [Deltaproteobacteria bacterium]|nr:hypothetical protein [Deltaproteobacteria bacterium]
MKITPFNKGIEDISWQSEDIDVQLPEPGLIAPSEIAPEHEVDIVIYTRSTEEAILESLRPQLRNKKVINPLMFNHLTTIIPKKLQQLAEKVDPKGKLIFLRAADYLEEQGRLMEVLNAYRKLLVQG